jgi:hypothetical protein
MTMPVTPDDPATPAAPAAPFDHFGALKTAVAAVKTEAQAGGLVATNQAVQDLCDRVTDLLNLLTDASNVSARDGVRPLLVPPT